MIQQEQKTLEADIRAYEYIHHIQNLLDRIMSERIQADQHLNLRTEKMVQFQLSSAYN